MASFRVVCAAALALVLAGCAAPGIPYDRSAAEVKRIGLVTPKMPADASVVLASSMGQSFGLIGALIDAGIQANRDTKFKEVLTQHSFSADAIFVQSVTGALQRHGYEVTVIPVTRADSEFLIKYPETEPKVDAYLDIVMNSYGYVAAGVRGSTPYRPSVAVRTRLVSAKNAAVLMQDTVIYNAINPGAPYNKHAVTVPPDPAYEFGNFDKLVASPAVAVKGLHVALEESAQTVSTLLK
jgi:hypothetical protein